jgi:hypothetical protein
MFDEFKYLVRRRGQEVNPDIPKANFIFHYRDWVECRLVEIVGDFAQR